MNVKGAKQVHYDSGPNMTPLVDVVMVILIFLMLAGSFGGAEHYLVSNLPVTQKGGAAVKSNKPADEPLDIRVDCPTQDRWIARAGKIQTSDFEQLRSQLAKMRKDFNAAGTKTENVQVIISPGRFVKYEYLIGVYQAAMDAEYTKIAFSTAH